MFVINLAFASIIVIINYTDTSGIIINIKYVHIVNITKEEERSIANIIMK